MKKQVLLIAPYIHDFAAYDLWLKPLGLLYIAAAAEEAGHEVRVVNCLDRLHPSTAPSRKARPSKADHAGRGKFTHQIIDRPDCMAAVPRDYKRYGIPLEAFRKELSEGPRPDIVGVGSMMTYWYGGVTETISIVRDLWPGIPVILGGIYATLCPEHAREHTGADVIVEGPGEEEFVKILDDNSPGPSGKRSRLLPPKPAYHLLGRLDSISMLTSFGCPFSCAYCASGLLRRGFHQRTVQDVVDEIAHYSSGMKIENIAFYDDALLVNPDRHIKPILREIIARRLRVRFHTPNGLHANMIDRELAGLMKQTGFATLRLSIESVNKIRLKDSCAKVTPEGFKTAVSNLVSAGYAPGNIEAYALMGAPGQQAEEVEQTIRMIHSAGAIVRLADFSPIPGTGYFDAAAKTYGIDLTEPLMQNSSALPHLVSGLLKQYQELKELANSLNADLKRRVGESAKHGIEKGETP